MSLMPSPQLLRTPCARDRVPRCSRGSRPGGLSRPRAGLISTATNHVTAAIRVGSGPDGVAVSPGGTHIYVVNQRYAMPRGTVSVITRR
jgi:DNA-binding beta-propeller fold protein YncE